MIRTGKLALFSLVALGGAVFALGCKVQVESLTRYEGTAFDVPGTWATGKNVTVTSPNGNVTVDAAAATGQLSVHAKPYDMQTGDEAGRQTAIDRMSNLLKVTVDDATGTITVSVGNTTYLGADIEVHLPADFDAALTVNQTGAGDVSVTGSGKASSTTASASAGSITARNLTNHVVLTGSAGDIDVSASPSGAGNSYKTDVGDITARIADTANLTITAKTDFGGTVTVPATWNANVAENKMSAGITLGDGSGALDVSTGNGQITFFGN